MKESKFLKDCINVVAGLEVKNEDQTIAKEVVLSALEIYEEIIHKAIEYINENTEIEHDGDDYGYMEWANIKIPNQVFIDNIISILKGEDKEC